MTETPLITIGITCYNAEDTIGRAIESARRQDWPNKEIIVIDDRSSDNSVSVVKKFNDVKLVIHTENTGPGGARQSLLDAAQGEFLAFFDDDDVSHPNRIRTQYEIIAKAEKTLNTTKIACYAAGERLYPNDYRVKINPIGQTEIYPHGKGVADHILYFGKSNPAWCYGACPSCALMARTQTFKQVGGFDADFRRVEDLDFAVRLALSDGYFIGTKEQLFTQHATWAPDKSHEKNLASELQLVEKHKSFLQTRRRYFYAKTWPKLRYYHFKRNYLHFSITLVLLLLRHPIVTLGHLFKTGPARLAHERRMNKNRSAT